MLCLRCIFSLVYCFCMCCCTFIYISSRHLAVLAGNTKAPDLCGTTAQNSWFGTSLCLFLPGKFVMRVGKEKDSAVKNWTCLGKIRLILWSWSWDRAAALFYGGEPLWIFLSVFPGNFVWSYLQWLNRAFFPHENCGKNDKGGEKLAAGL